jgi:hypothetical protein
VPGVDGKQAFVGPDGKMFLYADAREASDLGLRPATEEEFQKRTAEREREAKYGTASQQALAVGEKALSAATFDLAPSFPGAAERKAELEQQSPFLSFGATALGAAVPTLATGGAAGALLGAGRAGTAGTLLAEGVAGSLAEETERTRLTDEAIDYWNALGWGIGGAVLGHGLGALTRRGAVATDNVLARAERKALEADAKGARAAAAGPEKAAGSARSAEQVIDQASDEIATGLEQAAARVEELRAKVPAQKLDDLVAEPSPAQQEWAGQVAADVRAELDSAATARLDASAGSAAVDVTPETGSPFTLEGKTLEDFGYSPDDVDRPETLAALRNDEQFMSTGRATGTGKGDEGAQVGIKLRQEADGSLSLYDGTNRFKVAKEADLPSIYGTVYDSTGQEVLFQGDIPLKARGGDVTPPDGGGSGGPPESGARPRETSAEAAKRVLAEIRGRLPPGTEQRAWESAQSPSTFNPKTGQRERIKGSAAAGRHTKTGTTRDGKMIKQPYDPEKEVKGHKKFSKSADLTPSERAAYEALEPGEARQRWREDYQSQNLAQQFAVSRRSLDVEPGVYRYTNDWGPGVESALDVLNDAASDSGDVWRATQTLIRELPPESGVRAKLRAGVEDPALFGPAAKLAERLNNPPPIKAMGRDEIRALLDGDAASTRAGRAQLDQTLDAIDDVIEASEEFGLGKTDELVKLRDSIRREIANADTARVARSSAEVPMQESPRLGETPPATPAPGLLEGVASALGDKVVGVGAGLAAGALGLPGVAAAGAGWVAKEAFGKVLRNMSGAQKAAVARAARGFVGRGAKAASRAARAGAPGSVTALGMFQDDYPSPEASYLAKTEALKAAAADPTALPKVMAVSFGDLPVHYPRAYANAAAQMKRAQDYLISNLPVSTTASMISPRGLPPSRQQVRDFAVLWNSVTAPETVLESLADGTTTPKQVEALKAVHPGVYEQLRLDVMNEIGRNPARVPTQTKVWLDILFDLDGAAGLAYSSEAGKLFRATPPAQPASAQPNTKPPELMQPAGMQAMKSGPTVGVM